MTDSPSESIFAPRRWFIGADDHVRPFWRALLWLALAIVVVVLMSGPLHRFGEGVNRGGWSFGALLLTWFLLSTLDHRSFRTLGLWFYPGWWKETAIGIAIGIGLITLVTAGMMLTGALAFQGVNDAPNLARGLASASFLFLTAALFEEVAFRGYPFQRLMESFGALGAVLFFSALFGAAHINNPGSTALGTANTVLEGVLLAVTYIKMARRPASY